MSDFYDLMRAINTGGSGGGGTSNYNQLSNKPQINNVTLQGNKSLSDLGLYSKSEVDALVSGGGNIIETEIEFIEETYEEDGEEYTEIVMKFTNEEAILDAIYGENRDELNSPTIAIKYRNLYDPLEFSPDLPPGGVYKVISDEFTDYYYCCNTYEHYEENGEKYSSYFLELNGQEGYFECTLWDYDEQVSYATACCYPRSQFYIYTVLDENLKPCKLLISEVLGCVQFDKISLTEPEITSYLHPIIDIKEYSSVFFQYETEQYTYDTNLYYMMNPNDSFDGWNDVHFSTVNNKISGNSVYHVRYLPGCTVCYFFELVLNEDATFDYYEQLVGYLESPEDTVMETIVTGQSVIQGVIDNNVALMLTTNGSLRAAEPISGIDRIIVSLKYQIDPGSMPYLW